jgi:hypothetical protein
MFHTHVCHREPEERGRGDLASWAQPKGDKLNFRDPERVDRDQRAIIMVDIRATGKALHTAMIWRRHFVARAIGQHDHERFNRACTPSIQDFDNNDRRGIQFVRGLGKKRVWGLFSTHSCVRGTSRM